MMRQKMLTITLLGLLPLGALACSDDDEETTTETTEAAAEGGDPVDAEAGGGTAELTSESYDKSFTLVSCSLNADLSNASLQGDAEGITLDVEATEGAGTITVTGGDEQDGIDLNGEVTTVDISTDRTFSMTGTFGDPNLAGEEFTLSGSCPE